ncbi:uncharacterized protein LOC135826009 [Sycon ciliatum]|uniref:uncharacterized protein LOC135826009 n=1 Tax=Sycon ciliatum TaxID=27933 RepID=UPI0031F68ABB
MAEQLKVLLATVSVATLCLLLAVHCIPAFNKAEALDVETLDYDGRTIALGLWKVCFHGANDSALNECVTYNSTTLTGSVETARAFSVMSCLFFIGGLVLGLLLEKNEVHRLAYLLPKLFSLLSGTSMGIAAGVFQDVDADAYSMFLPDYITSPSTGFLVACSGVVGAVLCSMLSHWVHVSSRQSRTEYQTIHG